jgi:3-hydroxyacyl-[acyl-carrier-protein] dehydratase
MDAERLQALLPWRHPFLMLDRMLECRPHESIATRKSVSANDPAMGDEGTSYPAVLLLEGMSQSAALLFRLSYTDSTPKALPLLGFLRASVSPRAVLPGDAITYTVRSVKMTHNGGVFQGQARVDDEVVAEAELAFAASADHDSAGESGR